MSFEQSPQEIKSLFFAYFLLFDLMNAAAVSREWRSLALSELQKRLKRKKNQRDPSIFELFAESVQTGKSPAIVLNEERSRRYNTPDLHQLNVAGEPPLVVACEKHDYAVVKLLVGAGVDVDYAGRSPQDPLFIAYHSNATKIVSVLLSRSEDTQNQKCLFSNACADGRLEIVELIVAKILKHKSFDTSVFSQPFSLACSEGHVEVVRFLIPTIEGFKIDDEAKDLLLMRGLNSVVRKKHVDIALLFLSLSRCVLHSGVRALAYQAGHYEAVKASMLKEYTDVGEVVFKCLEQNYVAVVKLFVAEDVNNLEKALKHYIGLLEKPSVQGYYSGGHFGSNDKRLSAARCLLKAMQEPTAENLKALFSFQVQFKDNRETLGQIFALCVMFAPEPVNAKVDAIKHESLGMNQ